MLSFLFSLFPRGLLVCEETVISTEQNGPHVSRKKKSKCCVLALTLNSSRFGAQRIKLRELVGILLGWSA